MDRIEVCTAPIDVATEYAALHRDNGSDGACAMFVGSVRDLNAGSTVAGLALEHYPGMTEQCLQGMVATARKRWPLGRVNLLHRVGPMAVNEEIVFVGVTSPHRQAAFAACQYLMDRLKTEAPFWKQETIRQADGSSAQRWVEARTSDTEELEKWA